MAEGAQAGTATPTYDPPLAACPLCGAEKLAPFDEDFRQHKIDRCRGCGVMLMNPQYSDAWLREFYARYVSVEQPPEAQERWRSRPEVRRASKQRSLRLLAEFARDDGRDDLGRILMVGCGDGLELEIARQIGWRPEGYDVDPETTREVEAKVGVRVHSGDFAQLPLEAGSFDAVFLDQVIEHPKNPADFLTGAARLLRPGGLIYLGMPNIGSVANRWKTWLGRLGLRGRSRGKHYATKHHIFFYTPAVMRGLLEERFGFEVVHVSGSLKPDSNPLKPLFAKRLVFLDSSFVMIARRRAS